ncbi:hypothetical protein F7R01_04505 [Pseudomonas argentinensis]|nr:hypothetical protein F7R01_04505 [Pseudomonas argentinensis]
MIRCFPPFLIVSTFRVGRSSRRSAPTNARSRGTDLFSPSPSSTVFALTASHFLFARAKEKVTKEKARPTSGFRYAQLPSLRHCSEGRHGGPSLPRRPRPSFLVWHPCQTPLSTAPPLGLLMGFGDRGV